MKRTGCPVHAFDETVKMEDASNPFRLSFCYVKGFIMGCSEGGIHLYTMDHADSPIPAKMFNCRHSWRVDTTADVVSIRAVFPASHSVD